MTQTLPDWLAKRAALTGGQRALQYGETEYTFSELERHVQRCVANLKERGVRAGSHVALLLPNTPQFVWTIHALARIGATIVPLNLRLTDVEMLGQVKAADVEWLVYDNEFADTARSLTTGTRAVGIGIDAVVSEVKAVTAPDGRVDRSFALDQVHTIIFTSGTTGQPKGAMLTYGNHWWSAVGSVLNLGLRPDDKWLACLPLFHVGGMSILLRSVIYGIPVILHSRFDAEAVNRAIDEDGVSIISVVSSILARMLDARADRPFPPSLRCVLVGGGPVPQALLERCRRIGVPVVQTYGLTETASQVVTLAPQDAWRKLGSAGQPLFPVELRIEAEGRQAQPGEAGEIIIRGPNVMAGYYKRPEDTEAVLKDGWLYTGDIGYVDTDGYLYVLDRRDDLLISGGENVYPAEIEDVLVAHEAVEEAAVIGVADEQWGQIPIAFVKLRDGHDADADTLLAFCGERLAQYKVPKGVKFVDGLPRNASGKLLRRVLKEQVTGE